MFVVKVGYAASTVQGASIVIAKWVHCLFLGLCIYSLDPVTDYSLMFRVTTVSQVILPPKLLWHLKEKTRQTSRNELSHFDSVAKLSRKCMHLIHEMFLRCLSGCL